MILWIKAAAAGMPCDQRAEVNRIDGSRVYVTLCGTDEPAIVMPEEIAGIELTDSLQIMFNVTRVTREYVTRPSP